MIILVGAVTCGLAGYLGSLSLLYPWGGTIGWILGFGTGIALAVTQVRR